MKLGNDMTTYTWLGYRNATPCRAAGDELVPGTTVEVCRTRHLGDLHERLRGREVIGLMATTSPEHITIAGAVAPGTIMWRGVEGTAWTKDYQ